MKIRKCEMCGADEWDDKGEYYECSQCHEKVHKEQEPAKPDFKKDLVECLKEGNDNPTTLVGFVHNICDADPKDPLGILIDAFVKKDKRGLEFKKAMKRYFTSNKEEENFPVVISYLINHLSYGELGDLKVCLNEAKLPDDYQGEIERKRDALDEMSDVDSKDEADVFVCYSNDDEEKVKETVEAVEREGISCWYSGRDIPKNDPEEYRYEKHIKNAISSCKAFLFFASKNSRNSKYVKQEIKVATDAKIRNRVEYKISSKFKDNKGAFQDFFKGLQWIDASESDQSETLIARLKAMLSDESPLEPSSDEEAARKAAEEEERREAELLRQKELDEARAALEKVKQEEAARQKADEERRIREEHERKEAEAQRQKELEQARREGAEEARKKAEEDKRRETELRQQKELEEARAEAEKAEAKARQEEAKRKEAEERLSHMREEVKSKESESSKELFKQGMSLKRQGDYEKAFACFQKAAEYGDFKSLFMVAQFYENGIGVGKDEALARSYYKKSADAGSVDASYRYAEVCFEKNRNDEEGIRYLMSAAERDHPDAQYELARRYHYGNGVKERSVACLKWLGRAIANGSTEALSFKARHYPNEL